MSLKIDPSSVHLGANANGTNPDNKYVASYLAIDKASLPLKCKLPDELTYTAGPTALVPLDKACAFTFPDVLPLPPIYTPSTVQFSACETLKAYTEITTTAATKNTSLTLVASGPTPSSDGGPSDCSLKLVGLFDIDACTDFSASTNLNFKGAAAGSSLAINTTGTPDCGFQLTGDIDIDACETFSATVSNLIMGGALKGSYLTATAQDTPNCGLDLSGFLNVNACETFDAKASITMQGAPVKRSNFNITKSNIPNCGFNLTGDVLIEACANFSATSSVKFSGAAIKAGSLALTATSQPNCGVDLSGNIIIDACSTFTATNNLKVGGSAVRVNTPITISSTGTPACGFSLNGDINIDACTNTNVTIVTNTTSPGSITLRTDVPPGKADNWGTPYSTAKLVPRGYSLWQNGCDIGIMITMDSIDLAIPSYISLYDATVTPTPKDGCSWSEEQDSIFLQKDPHKNSLHIGGNLPIPCFACDTAQYTASGPKPYLFSDLELNSLSVGNLTANQCCQNSSADGNKLDLCNGEFKLYKNTDQPSPKVEQLNIAAGQLTFSDNAVAQTRIETGYLYMIDASLNSVAIEPSSFTMTDNNLADTSLTMNAYSLYYTNSSNSTLELDADNVALTASNGATLSLAVNAGLYLSSNSSGTNNVSVTYNSVVVSSPSYSATVAPYQIKLNPVGAPTKGTTIGTTDISIFSDTSAGSILLSANALEGKQAFFKKISICEDGKTKSAYVLMTDTF